MCILFFSSTYIWYIVGLAMVQLKEFIGGNVVGSGSNYIVVQKDGKRFLIELKDFSIIELKKFTTPYGSDF
ncbi:MAG: hypothetical protein WA323_08000 [Candidatus Nitrosopolaris sp.]|jgi:hypothetical protein